MALLAALRAVGDLLARKLLGIAVFGVGSLALLAAMSLFSAQPVATFFRLLSYLGVGLAAAAVIGLLLTFRAARTLAPAALVVAAITTALTGTIGLLVLSQRPSAIVAFATLSVGAALGAYWSSRLVLDVDCDTVRARGTLWHFAIWAVAYIANQAVAGSGGVLPLLGALGLLLSTGLSVGNGLSLAVRVQRAGGRNAMPASGATAGGRDGA